MDYLIDLITVFTIFGCIVCPFFGFVSYRASLDTSVCTDVRNMWKHTTFKYGVATAICAAWLLGVLVS